MQTTKGRRCSFPGSGRRRGDRLDDGEEGPNRSTMEQSGTKAHRTRVEMVGWCLRSSSICVAVREVFAGRDSTVSCCSPSGCLPLRNGS